MIYLPSAEAQSVVETPRRFPADTALLWSCWGVVSLDPWDIAIGLHSPGECYPMYRPGVAHGWYPPLGLQAWLLGFEATSRGLGSELPNGERLKYRSVAKDSHGFGNERLFR